MKRSKNARQDTNERARMRSFLQAHGLTAQMAANLSPSTRNRGEIAIFLRDYLKQAADAGG